jgi:hypothetical protein
MTWRHFSVIMLIILAVFFNQDATVRGIFGMLLIFVAGMVAICPKIDIRPL